jgi:hypothetical protein
MGLPPVRAQVAGGSALSVVDYRSEYLTTLPAGNDGILTIDFEPVPPGLLWLLQRTAVSTTSTTPTRALLYAGAAVPQNFLDGTERGNLDVADNASPVLVESSTSLTVQWTGASPGAIGTIRIQYQLVSRG